jgi:hypothetical protein
VLRGKRIRGSSPWPLRLISTWRSNPMRLEYSYTRTLESVFESKTWGNLPGAAYSAALPTLTLSAAAH